MQDPTSLENRFDKRLKFSLLQFVAVTTSGVAAFVLCRSLFSPPYGSSGLAEARLPAVLLLIAIWFCCRSTVTRLASYTIVASLLALTFFLSWLVQTDWLMGHTHGPPQLLVATGMASVIGALSGISWFVNNIVARHVKPQSTPTLPSRTMRTASWMGSLSVRVLTLLAILLALFSIPSVSSPSRIRAELDRYMASRLTWEDPSIYELAEAANNARSPARVRIAEIMENAFIQSDEEAAIPALSKLMLDDDPRVRRAAVNTLRRVIAHARSNNPQFHMKETTKSALVRGLSDRDGVVQRVSALAIMEQTEVQRDSEARLSALTALGSPQDRESLDEVVPTLLGVLASPTRNACRREAIRSLGRIGPAAGIGGWTPASRQAVPTLARELERSGRSERALAAEALGAMGRAAGAAVPSFGRAWQQGLLTIEDAQALYQIDPIAAERWGIPHPDTDPTTMDSVAGRDDASNAGERVDQGVRQAIDTIEHQSPEIERRLAAPENVTEVHTTPSDLWITQTPYVGDPRNRPRGTIYVQFEDDYVWLIRGSVQKRLQWVEDGREIRAVISGTRRYEHALGTHEVRVVDARTSLSVDDVSSDSRSHLNVDDGG